MRMTMCKTPVGFVPYGDEDYDKFVRLNNKSPYIVEVKTERNGKFHRLYMGFLRRAWEYLPEEKNKFFKDSFDGFRKAIELASGSYEPIYNATRQEWIQVPKSISFNSMSQQEFEDLFDKTKDVVFGLFLTHISVDEFFENFEMFYK